MIFGNRTMSPKDRVFIISISAETKNSLLLSILYDLMAKFNKTKLQVSLRNIHVNPILWCSMLTYEEFYTDLDLPSLVSISSSSQLSCCETSGACWRHQVKRLLELVQFVIRSLHSQVAQTAAF